MHTDALFRAHWCVSHTRAAPFIKHGRANFAHIRGQSRHIELVWFFFGFFFGAFELLMFAGLMIFWFVWIGWVLVGFRWGVCLIFFEVWFKVLQCLCFFFSSLIHLFRLYWILMIFYEWFIFLVQWVLFSCSCLINILKNTIEKSMNKCGIIWKKWK